MKSKIFAILAAFMLFLPLNGFAETQMKKLFTDQDVIQLLEGEGYGGIDKRKEGVIAFKVDGQTYAIYNTYEGDLQCYYAIGGASVSYQEINEWNKTKRLSRAYLDSDGDPVLEADLLADEGLTDKQVARFIRVFIISSQKFRTFVAENSK